MAFTTDRERTAHLLRRFGLGSSEAELDYYAQGGYRAAVDRLIGFEGVEDAFAVPLEKLANPQGQISVRAVQAHWYLRLAVTTRPLQEKLTLFWHDHFAVSAQKVDVALALAEYVDVLRQNALASFPDLALAALRSPAMLYWLDNHLNVKGKPNENFAREVFELFTLGIGQYTEADVQEAARAFTGWGFGIGPARRQAQRPVRSARFVFREGQHDASPKTILGATDSFDGDDVVQMAAYHPQTARHLVTKVWEWFVYPGPEESLVDRFARGWRAANLSIKWLVREIVLSPEFVSEKAERATYKNPIDYTISTYRQLGVGRRAVESLATAAAGQALRALAPMAPLAQATKSMGMDLLFPPDVAGWEGGQSWISTATMVERMKWADRLFGAPERNRSALRYPAGLLFEGDSSPEGAVGKLLSVFDAEVGSANRATLVASAREASGGQVTERNASAVALAVCRPLFGSPEFQMN